jgi:hypothetical protein
MWTKMEPRTRHAGRFVKELQLNYSNVFVMQLTRFIRFCKCFLRCVKILQLLFASCEEAIHLSTSSQTSCHVLKNSNIVVYTDPVWAFFQKVGLSLEY